MTTTTIEDFTLLHLDPRKLIVDKNVRSKLGDLTGLTKSIREHGVHVALTVSLEDDGSYRVIAGGRRSAAAILAERDTVPCIVRVGIDTDRALLEAQMIENLAREDLTPLDIAAGFEQLVVYGLDEAMIADATTRPVAEVKAGLSVAASAPAKKAMKTHALNLEQAAAVAEFEGDAKAVAELLNCSADYPEDFAHTVSQLRDRLAEVAKAEEFRAKLADEGVKIAEARPSWDRRLTDLTDAKGKKLTPASHKKCPGHYAYIEVPVSSWDKAGVIYACEDPAGNGHKSTNGSSHRGGGTAIKTDAEREAESAQRKKVIANNKAWRAAESVRLPFVRELLKRKTAKGVLRFVTEEILGAPGSVRAEDKVLCDLLGMPEPKDTFTAKDGFAYSNIVGLRHARQANEARLPMVLLAQVAANREESMGIHTWRNGGVHGKTVASGPRRWLDFLAANGYAQSEIEKTVR